MESVEKVEKILQKIIDKRKEKGLSIENVASDLNISIGAYHKIEKGETKLSLERFFEIIHILKIKIDDIVDLETKQVYNQNFNDNSVFHQEIQNLYQDNRELVDVLVKSLKGEIEFLREQLKK